MYDSLPTRPLLGELSLLKQTVQESPEATWVDTRVFMNALDYADLCKFGVGKTLPLGQSVEVEWCDPDKCSANR